MTKASPFEIFYDELVAEHLDAIESKYLSLIRNTIETQLRFGPNNRFRVFYDTHLTEKQVVVLAIGVKIRNELWIGKERVGNYENRTPGTS